MLLRVVGTLCEDKVDIPLPRDPNGGGMMHWVGFSWWSYSEHQHDQVANAPNSKNTCSLLHVCIYSTT